MKTPVLVIMAAGMGSRYGGLKQIDPIDKSGHIIMDFSIYDAKKAGFKKVIFIIKRENESLFRQTIGDRISREMEVVYAYQDMDNLPDGYFVPEGRTKPFGTGHAVLCCRHLIDGPFAVINADDYYGSHGFQAIYDFLVQAKHSNCYAMVSYNLCNTVTKNGHVARGICMTDSKNHLIAIHERTRIEQTSDGIAFTEDDGKTWHPLSDQTPVSMNLWGFTKDFLEELKKRFPKFLNTTLLQNPLKGEYFLPFVVDELIQEGKATVHVLPSPDKWYGVTYQEDKEFVSHALVQMEEQGIYPF